MEIKVDLTNIPSNDVPEGVYTLRVEKCDVVDSKSTAGAQNMKLDLIVTDQGEYTGRHVFDNISLLPQVLWRVRDFVNACGVFPGPEGFRTEDLLGRTVRAMVTAEADKQNPGKTRMRISNYSVA